jgi:alkylation response protein AidB-like acyl-CoA dehydrogenase
VTTAVQVFGGMGFTWECDAHIWFKRVGYDRQMFGGPVELRAAGASLGE